MGFDGRTALAERGFDDAETRLRHAAAAVLRQERHERRHALEVDRVIDEAAFLPSGDEAALRERLQVERQGCRRNVELLSDDARSHALRPRLDEETEDRKTGVLRERGERGDGVFDFHVSSIMEM